MINDINLLVCYYLSFSGQPDLNDKPIINTFVFGKLIYFLEIQINSNTSLLLSIEFSYKICRPHLEKEKF